MPLDDEFLGICEMIPVPAIITGALTPQLRRRLLKWESWLQVSLANVAAMNNINNIGLLRTEAPYGSTHLHAGGNGGGHEVPFTIRVANELHIGGVSEYWADLLFSYFNAPVWTQLKVVWPEIENRQFNGFLRDVHSLKNLHAVLTANLYNPAHAHLNPPPALQDLYGLWNNIFNNDLNHHLLAALVYPSCRHELFHAQVVHWQESLIEIVGEDHCALLNGPNWSLLCYHGTTGA